MDSNSTPALEKLSDSLSKMGLELSVRQSKLRESMEKDFLRFVRWNLDEFVKNEFTLDKIFLLKLCVREETQVSQESRVKEVLEYYINEWTNELLNPKLTPTNLPYSNCLTVSLLEAKSENLKLFKNYLSFFVS